MANEPINDTIRFEFHRHSIKDASGGERLGWHGAMLARTVGAQQLRGQNFTHFYVSTLWRSVQTLAAFDEGAGDFHALIQSPPCAPLYTSDPRIATLNASCRLAEQRGEDMVRHAFTFNEQLTNEIATDLRERFQRWLNNHKPGDHLLIVGHSPGIELLIYSLYDYQVRQLGFAQGVRFTYRDGTLFPFEVTPQLNV